MTFGTLAVMLKFETSVRQSAVTFTLRINKDVYIILHISKWFKTRF